MVSRSPVWLDILQYLLCLLVASSTNYHLLNLVLLLVIEQV